MVGHLSTFHIPTMTPRAEERCLAVARVASIGLWAIRLGVDGKTRKGP